MELWHRLSRFELTWTGLFVLVACWVVALFLRRLLPESRRYRGRWSAYGLGAAPLVHLVATGLTLIGLPSVGAALHLCNIVVVVSAATGVASMLVFDIVLARTRFAVSELVRDLSHVALFGVLIVSVLRSVGINPSSIVATSAVVTGVVGLAMQNALANVGAGILLQIDRSIRVGDWIQFGTRTGRVEAFQWRATAMRTLNSDLSIVPNTQLLTTEVLNLSRPRRSHRIVTKLTFHRRHPPGEIAEMVTAVLRGVPGVLDEPSPGCHPVDFGATSITCNAVYWIDDMEQQPRVEGEVYTRIWYASWRAGIEGPCPARTEPDAQEVDARRGALAAAKLFAPMETSQRELLVPMLRPMLYAKGERIIAEGAAGDSMFLLARGSVAVNRQGAGLATLGVGDAFGEMSLLTGEARTATCHAESECLCYALDADAFRSLLATQPALAEEITGLVARRQGEGGRAGEERVGETGAARDAALWKRVRGYFRL